MNIMLFSRILAKTGVGNHIKQLATELTNQGNKVIIVSGTQEIELENDAVSFIKIPTLTRNPITFLKNIKQIHNIISENNIDVVHCHHRMAGLYMKIYNIFYRIPVVYTLHLANIPCDFLHRKMTYSGNISIAVSSEVKEFLTEKLRIPAHKVVTVLNGVDESRLLPLTDAEYSNIKSNYGIKEDKIVIAMHSRIDEVKNQLLVVEAVNKLSEEAKKQIVVVCSGEAKGDYYGQVVSKIAEYGLKDNFRFVGWTSTREILGISDFLFLPSTNEGFPLNVAEAFLMHIPVARSETAGFKDQKYCFPISSSDPEDTVKILTDLCEGREAEYCQNIETAYEYALNNFTLKVMTEKTMDVYKKACEKSGKR